MSDRTVRASEIGTYQFCKRAWWYEKQDATPTNAPRLEHGKNWHHARERKVIAAGRLQLAALVLIFLSLLTTILMLRATYLG